MSQTQKQNTVCQYIKISFDEQRHHWQQLYKNTNRKNLKDS